MELNPYYNKVIKEMSAGNDSIFEEARIDDFNPKTLQAKIYGLRSKQEKENVTVLFPSFYMNTGIITFPQNGTTGMSFVGANNETFFFPAQFFLPTKTAENGQTKSNAAPGQFDFLLELTNFQPGELLLRSISQAQMFISNNGEIELSTKKLNRLLLSDIDGSFEVNVEQIRELLGYSTWYKGFHEATNPTLNDLPEQHIYSVIYDKIPNWENAILTEGEANLYSAEATDLNGFLENLLEMKDYPKFIEQSVNVYAKTLRNTENSLDFTNQKIISSIDGKPLYSQKELFGTASGDATKNTRVRKTEIVSAEGATQTKIMKNELNESIEITHTSDTFQVLQTLPTHTARVDMSPEYIEIQKKNVFIKVTENDVFIKPQGSQKTVSFNEIINKLDALLALNELDTLTDVGD